MKTLHSTFTLERSYPSSPQRVFEALSVKEQRRKWFVDGPGFTTHAHELDFSINGREYGKYQPDGGPVIEFFATYQDIVANERICVAYSMGIDGRPFSASLQTIELEADGKGTRLFLTEFGAHFNGSTDEATGREEGTRGMLETLAAFLKA